MRVGNEIEMGIAICAAPRLLESSNNTCWAVSPVKDYDIEDMNEYVN